MSETARMVIRDPASFPLLTTDLKEKIIEGAVNTVNIQGFQTRKGAQENIRTGFINRNAWTARSVMVTQMPHGRYSLSAVQATVGITEGAAYMERQEFGGDHTPASGGTLAIPTDVARGGAIDKAVQKPFRLSQLKRLKVRGRQGKGKSHKARAVARAAVAFRERLLIQYGGNLHFVEGFSAGGKNSQPSFRLRQVYDFSKPSTKTKPKPWMRPAYEKVASEGERIFLSQMKKLWM